MNKTIKTKPTQFSPQNRGSANLVKARQAGGPSKSATPQLKAQSLPASRVHGPNGAPQAPPVFRPNSVPKVLQSKIARPEPRKRILAQGNATVMQKVTESSIVQPFASRVVQAVKYYPNLHPGAVEPVDRGNVFRLNSFANQYRLHRVNSHSVNVPNQQYNFVRTREGEMLLHARYRHPSIAQGQQVLYAGEIFFNNGQLEWWSNGSGHYQPFAEDAVQANLPMDQFFSYQQIIKGEHKRKEKATSR